MRKFTPENWRAILTDLNAWLGSDYKIEVALSEIVENIPINYADTLHQLRTNSGSLKEKDVSDTIGRALRYLHNKYQQHQQDEKRRQYIRHPTTVPIEIRESSSSGILFKESTSNVSRGGVAFHSPQSFPIDTLLNLRIDLVDPPFQTFARVAWRQANPNGGYDIGVQFMSQADAEEARMVEQICHIESYRKNQEREHGRALDIEEAAVEWLTEHGRHFPQSLEGNPA